MMMRTVKDEEGASRDFEAARNSEDREQIWRRKLKDEGRSWVVQPNDLDIGAFLTDPSPFLVDLYERSKFERKFLHESFQ